MHEEIAKKWVARLRDPEAKQAQEILGTPDGARCCLGVLCDIYAEEVKGAKWATDDVSGYQFMDRHWEPSKSYLTTDVMEWAGMAHPSGTLPVHLPTTGKDGSDELSGSLAGLNDGGWSFTRIAEVIDKNWEEL